MAYDWKKDLPALEAKYDIPPGLLGALVRAESGGRTNARSPAGAIGLAQLMPGTARGLGVNPNDPRQNLEGGAKYLSQQLKRFKNVEKALAAYNAGPGAVQKYGGIPPYKETQTYVKRLTGYWKESSRYGAAPTSRGQSPKISQRTARRAEAVPVPQGIPEPQRRIQPGLDDRSVNAVNIGWAKSPATAEAILGKRMRQQNKLDTKYASDLTTFNARQREIAAAQQANNLQIQQANKYIPGAVGGTSGNSLGIARPGQRYFKTPKGWIERRREGEKGYEFLQRLGGKGFGLRNDPGNSQTFGGSHTPGSDHYAYNAVDYGNARNSETLLNQWVEYLRKNQKALGIKQVIWKAPGHYEHAHAAVH